MMSGSQRNTMSSLSLIALVCAILFLAIVPEQKEFILLFIGFVVAFGAYYFTAISHWLQPKIKPILITAIVLRLLLIPFSPNLSDDVYRYLFDGREVLAGQSPYAERPIDNVAAQERNADLPIEFLNSESYYSVYPPISQGLFTLSALVSSQNKRTQRIVLKSLLTLLDIGSLFFILAILRILKKKVELLAIYALNPLVLIELNANMHLESVMIFFLLASILLYLRARWKSSAVLFGLAVGVKILPLMLVPFFWKRLGTKNFLLWCLILGLTVVICFFPLWNIEYLTNYAESIRLYFKTFEFNASFYYICRWIGEGIYGYNPIHKLGPLLSIFVFVMIILGAWKERLTNSFNIFDCILFCFSIYLFFATTVHPWYLAVLVMASIFSSFRFAILWSGLIMLSYSTYFFEAGEQLWIIAIEYILLFSFLIWELKKYKSLERAH